MPPSSGALRQGEILSEVWEYRVDFPSVKLPSHYTVQPIEYPRLIVMAADCDLLWDYESRQRIGRNEVDESNENSILPHILLCRAYEQAEIRNTRPTINSSIWQRISKNQDERYHHLNAADVGGDPTNNLPDLYLDFKKSLSIPTSHIYSGMESSDESSRINRIAIVPPIYVHDMMHRFYGFLSRVGTPD